MNPNDDLSPTDLARLRTALERRAAGTTSSRPADLLSSAQRRASSLHRRHVAGSALAAVLCAGVLAGALVANHGRATVGVSVSGPTATTDAPSTSWTGPTTTIGDDGVPAIVACGASFFPVETMKALEGHFGPRLDCGRVGDTWVVSFNGPALAVGVLRCDPADTTCLDGSAEHDLASFRVVLLEPVSTDTPGGTWSTRSPAPVGDPAVVTWLPRVAPTPSPVPSVRIAGTPSDVTIEEGFTCEPGNGPSTTEWTGKPTSVTNFPDALALPVPDWRSELAGQAGGSC